MVKLMLLTGILALPLASHAQSADDPIIGFTFNEDIGDIFESSGGFLCLSNLKTQVMWTRKFQRSQMYYTCTSKLANGRYKCGFYDTVEGSYNPNERKLVFAGPSVDRPRDGIKAVFIFDYYLDKPESVMYVRGIKKETYETSELPKRAQYRALPFECELKVTLKNNFSWKSDQPASAPTN